MLKADQTLESIAAGLAEILQEIEQDTGAFLDMEAEEIPDFTVSYKGKAVSFPLDFAEINNTTTDFLSELLEVIKEY